MSQTQGKILIIRGGAIGDFILTLPVFAALRDRFPQTQLEVLGYPHIAQLAWAGGLVDHVRSIEARALAGFFARHGTLDPSLREYFAGFAVVISYLYDPDEIFRTNIARCSKAQFIAGPHRPDEKLNLHATEVFLKPLERLAIFEVDSAPRLTIQVDRYPTGILIGRKRALLPHPGGALSSSVGNEQTSGSTVPVQARNSEAIRASERDEIRLALHPGSGSEKKNWPEARWAELIERLTAKVNWNFLLVGGEAEGERLNRLARFIPPERLHIAQSLPLVELAINLQQCHLFIGHDSGISHLAAAAGLNGLALWGETNPAIWRPCSDRVEVLLSRQGLAHLEVKPVLEALLRLTSALS